MVHLTERQWPSSGTWAFSALMAVSMGVALGAATAEWVGAVAALGTQTLAGVALLRSATIVRVDDHVVRAGRARLPLTAVGSCTALDAPSTRRILGADADPAAHLATRPWIRTAVRIDLTDPLDPHPYWVVSTRRPARLCEAIRAARAARPAGPAPR